MPVSSYHGDLPAHVLHEAARLFLEICDRLHGVDVDGDGVLFAFSASPQLADRLAAFGAEAEDDEDDGTAELDECPAPPMLNALLTPLPRQGYAVPAWSRSFGASEAETAIAANEQGPSDLSALGSSLVCG